MFSEWISTVWLRVRAMGRRERLDRDLRDEIAFHLAMREEKLKGKVHGEDGKMGEKHEGQEARYAAQRGFGNPTQIKEATRSVWTFRWAEELGQDLRYALRSMRKSPAIAAVVVLSLALGIGANTAIFTLMNAVMLRLLPVQHPEQLLQVQRKTEEGAGAGANSFTNPLWEAVRDQQDVFSGIFAWSASRLDLEQGGEAKYADDVWVSGAYFSTLGIEPALGRLIAPSDDQRGCATTAVLSYGFWQQHYGGQADVLGKTIMLNRQPFEIIGVAQQGFTGMDVGSKFDVATPICATRVFDGKESRLDQRSWWWLAVAGRMKPGLTQQQVTARLATISSQIMNAALPQNWAAKNQEKFLKTKLVTAPAGGGVSPLHRTFARPMTILMCIVAVVLLIACANIASLMLARATSRAKELAIRRAIGASRGRLMRQLLTESLLLSAVGALLGLAFARWGAGLLVQRISVGHSRVFLDLSPDLRVLGFTAGVAILAGLLVGVLPAARSTRVSLMAAMKTGQTANLERTGQFGAGKWIVAAQVALSLVLVVSGALLLRSLQKLLNMDAGFDRHNVLLVEGSMDRTNFTKEERAQTFDEIQKRLATLPGVISVARSFTTPLKGWEWNNFVHSDAPNAPSGEQSLAFFNAVTPEYFRTVGMQLLAGRDLSEQDTATSPPVAVINETMARRFFPGLNALGQRFRVEADPGKTSPLVEVVGVVKDAKYESLREETQPTAFFPVAQSIDKVGSYGFELRTSVPPMTLSEPVARAAAGVNKSVSLEFRTLSEQVDDDLMQDRLLATLSGFFGGLALVLAMIGLYGVLSYLVTQRQAEFGIRMALGARPQSILGLVMHDSLIMLAGGVAGGLAISWVAVKLLQKLLFGLSPHDALTTFIAVAVLVTVGLIAALLPARRATRVDPMVALRYE